jgi:hypothetical protein
LYSFLLLLACVLRFTCMRLPWWQGQPGSARLIIKRRRGASIAGSDLKAGSLVSGCRQIDSYPHDGRSALSHPITSSFKHIYPLLLSFFTITLHPFRGMWRPWFLTITCCRLLSCWVACSCSRAGRYARPHGARILLPSSRGHAIYSIEKKSPTPRAMALVALGLPPPLAPRLVEQEVKGKVKRDVDFFLLLQ